MKNILFLLFFVTVNCFAGFEKTPTGFDFSYESESLTSGSMGLVQKAVLKTSISNESILQAIYNLSSDGSIDFLNAIKVTLKMTNGQDLDVSLGYHLKISMDSPDVCSNLKNVYFRVLSVEAPQLAAITTVLRNMLNKEILKRRPEIMRNFRDALIKFQAGRC